VMPVLSPASSLEREVEESFFSSSSLGVRGLPLRPQFEGLLIEFRLVAPRAGASSFLRPWRRLWLRFLPLFFFFFFPPFFLFSVPFVFKTSSFLCACSDKTSPSVQGSCVALPPPPLESFRLCDRCNFSRLVFLDSIFCRPYKFFPDPPPPFELISKGPISDRSAFFFAPSTFLLFIVCWLSLLRFFAFVDRVALLVQGCDAALTSGPFSFLFFALC